MIVNFLFSLFFQLKLTFVMDHGEAIVSDEGKAKMEEGDWLYRLFRGSGLRRGDL